MIKYQSIIINFLDETSQSIEKKIDKIKAVLLNLNQDGIVWVIVSNYVHNSELVMTSFEVARQFLELKLKNIILVPDFRRLKKGMVFINSTYEILFFTKSETYFFNKDPIREKHIWKDVEWGKRAKNYHELGKDPGNVWLKTEDDGKSRITKHVLLNFNEVIDRLIKSSLKKRSNCLLINLSQIKDSTAEVNIYHESV